MMQKHKSTPKFNRWTDLLRTTLLEECCSFILLQVLDKAKKGKRLSLSLCGCLWLSLSSEVWWTWVFRETWKRPTCNSTFAGSQNSESEDRFCNLYKHTLRASAPCACLSPLILFSQFIKWFRPLPLHMWFPMMSYFFFLLCWPFTVQLVSLLLETTLPSLRHMLLFLGPAAPYSPFMGHITLHGHYHCNWQSSSIFSRELGAGTISWLCYPGTNRKS